MTLISEDKTLEGLREIRRVFKRARLPNVGPEAALLKSLSFTLASMAIIHNVLVIDYSLYIKFSREGLVRVLAFDLSKEYGRSISISTEAGRHSIKELEINYISRAPKKLVGQRLVSYLLSLNSL